MGRRERESGWRQRGRERERARGSARARRRRERARARARVALWRELLASPAVPYRCYGGAAIRRSREVPLLQESGDAPGRSVWGARERGRRERAAAEQSETWRFAFFRLSLARAPCPPRRLDLERGTIGGDASSSTSGAFAPAFVCVGFFGGRTEGEFFGGELRGREQETRTRAELLGREKETRSSNGDGLLGTIVVVVLLAEGWELASRKFQQKQEGLSLSLSLFPLHPLSSSSPPPPLLLQSALPLTLKRQTPSTSFIHICIMPTVYNI